MTVAPALLATASTKSLPPLAQARIGFIGAGRLGKALAWRMHEAGLCVAAVSSATPASAQALAARIPDCETTRAQEVIDRCDLVFVATPDGAIATTASSLRWRPGMAAVHCSGVTEVDALEVARSHGACIGGFHPMQTFGDPQAVAASLKGCTITLEADEPLNMLLVALVERIGCHVNRLPAGMRGRYHAAAGFTSQFINALFAEAAVVWKSWGADESDALRALLPLARGTLASIESAGIAGGMPGPVSRGDVASVEKHVAALAPLGDEMLAFYRLMCGRTVPIARRRGAIDESVADRIRAALAPREVEASRHKPSIVGGAACRKE